MVFFVILLHTPISDSFDIREIMIFGCLIHNFASITGSRRLSKPLFCAIMTALTTDTRRNIQHKHNDTHIVFWHRFSSISWRESEVFLSMRYWLVQFIKRHSYTQWTAFASVRLVSSLFVTRAMPSYWSEPEWERQMLSSRMIQMFCFLTCFHLVGVNGWFTLQMD